MASSVWSSVWIRALGGVAGLILSGLVAGRVEGAPEPVGAWGFDNPADLLQASAGGDLVLEGAHTAVPGLGAGDGAVRVGIGSYYRCEHGVAANGLGNYVNQYSLLFDYRIPQLGPWYCFFQTSPANQNDGDCFVRANDGAIGVGQTGYSVMRAQPGVWQRLLVAVDNAAGIYDLYLDGELILDGAPQSIDGRFALDPVVLFFADENGEDAPIDVTRIAIYDRALTAAEAAELGLPQVDDPANRAPEMIPGASGPGLVATGAPVNYAFTGTDPDEELVQVRVDWGDGEVSAWSSLVPSGTAVVQTHTFRLPGKYLLRAIARDQRGKLGVWTEIQIVEVEGDPAVQFLTPPYLQNVKPDGITIMWECDVAVDGEVRYGSGPTPAGLQPATTVASGGGTYIYKAVLRGLLPGTVYPYEVRVGGAALPAGTFTTAPLGHGEFAFAVWADSQGSNHGAYGPDPLEPTTSMMRHMGLSGIQFAVGAGDHAENGGSYSDTRQYYLDRVARWLGSAVPWYVAWGNHDGGRGTVIRKFADLPSQERSGFDAGYGSYSFDYAGCHFICIDYATAVGDIRTWLEADLRSEANRNARFTFLFVHVPPYCELWIDGNGTYRSELVPLLEAYGVDLCFSGHTHEYSRGYLNGVFYCITGGGSWLDLPEVLVRDWEHMTVGGYHPIPGVPQYGPTRGGGLINEYVRVDVRADSFTASMIGFNPDGTEVGVLDVFESTAAQAPLRIAAIRRSEEFVELEWTGPDGPFQVQFRPEVGQGTWIDLGEPVAAAARTTALPATTAAGLYRIRLVR